MEEETAEPLLLIAEAFQLGPSRDRQNFVLAIQRQRERTANIVFRRSALPKLIESLQRLEEEFHRSPPGSRH